jgi:hypothetical protein
MTDSSYFPLSMRTISAIIQARFVSGFLPNELARVDGLINGFMTRYNVPGLSLAITQSGCLVYAKGFGVARKRSIFEIFFRRSPEEVDVWTRFRIASITKPITSTAIFKLAEQRKLSLGDKVFDSSGILGNEFGFGSLTPESQNILAGITIQNLLEHTSGGWPNDGQDPMFVQTSLDKAQLIEWVLKNRPLDHPPGKSIEFYDPIPNDLHSHAANFCGCRPCRAVVDGRQSQMPPRLRAILGPLRRGPCRLCVVVSPESNGHGEPPSFATLNKTRAHLETLPESQSPRLGIN